MSKFDPIAVVEAAVFDITTPKSKKKRARPRDFYSLSYRFDGEITVKTKDKSLVSTADTVTFVPSGVGYETTVRHDTHMIVVHFRLAADVEFRHPEIISADGTELRALFISLYDAYRAGASAGFKCLSVLYSIFAALEQREVGDLPLCVVAARKIIDERFCDPDLSLVEVAAQAGVSDSYLRRAFRTTMGMSAVDYLCRVRIKNARSMLESECFTVAEIGARCGFREACYFVRKFRECVGVTPGEFRKRAKISGFI
jgi:AraC-like DNA-binding protein